MARDAASDDDKARIKRNVRDRRLRAGYTQLELAVEAGVSIGAVYWAERAGRSSMSTLEKLAGALGCTTATLLR